MDTFTLNLITLYGPNSDSPNFFKTIQNFLQNEHVDYNIICEDINLVLSPDLDSYNYKHINNPKARKIILKMMNDELCDVYRNLHQDTKRYTWRCKNPLKQARLNFYLISSNMMDLANKCQTRIAYRSDHSAIELEIMVNKFTFGKGIWKFNNSLLKNQDYLNLVNKVINEEIQKYAIPVYNLEFLQQNTSEIQFTIDYDTFIEMLFLRTHGESINCYLKRNKLIYKVALLKI